MSDPRDPSAEVHVMLIAQEDGEIIGVASADLDSGLVRPDGAADGLVHRIAARKIAAAEMLVRRSRNR